MKVYEIADTRCGDKGDISNVCVFVRRDEDWDLLKERLTAAAVRRQYGEPVQGDVAGDGFPVLKRPERGDDQAVGGGVSMSLPTDPYGWRSPG